MADTIVITKTPAGVVLVNNGGREYTLDSNYRVQKEAATVKIFTDQGRFIDEFDPVEVEKLVLADASEVLDPDLDTLFTQLHTNFFFVKSGLIGPASNLEFISDANSSLGEDGNYRFKMVAGKLQTQRLDLGVWVALEEI